jgi:Uncharacterized protein conserved in bacteria
MKRTLIAVAALLASGAAWADDCSNANTQTEMNQCAAAQYQAADKKLNETWEQALKRASGKQLELLKKAQQAGFPCVTPTARFSLPARKAAVCNRC